MQFKEKTKDLLKYAVALHIRGDDPTAGLYASACFESLLPKQLDRTDRYIDRVNRLIQSSSRLKNISKKVKDCITYRNDIVHNAGYEHVPKILYNLQTILDIDFSKKENKIDDEEFRFFRKRATGLSPVISSKYTQRAFEGITEEDFRNLFELKEKILFLRESLASYCANELDPPLFFDDISEVNNNSAWVWLAAVTTLERDRPKIELPSLSVLATNKDIRVYLEFGGRCKFERKKYYKLLLQKGLDTELMALGGKSVFFDVYWYFNIENVQSIQHFIEQRDLGKIVFDRDYLQEEFENYTLELKQKKTIPNNKCLVGSVYSKEDVVAMGAGFVDEVKKQFRVLSPIIKKVKKGKD